MLFVCQAEALRDKPVYGSSNGFIGSTPEHVLRCGIEKDNIAFRVGGDDCVHSRPNDTG